MRHIALDSSFANQLLKGKKIFYTKDLNKSFPTLTPGEWVTLTYEKAAWCAYANPHAQGVPIMWIMAAMACEDPWQLIQERIVRSIELRSHLYINEGKRLVYGQSDDLPGLIVDAYDDHVLIQINTAGMDKYREQIQKLISEIVPQKNVWLFDHTAYRMAESLPSYPATWKGDEIIYATDSGFKYVLSVEKMQKLGFYYDHRDNRKKFETYLKTVAQKKETCLDLFCYLGSWGMHACRGGVERVDLVDQANLQEDILLNLRTAGYENRAKFYRDDVFKFLDKAIEDNKKWDVIVCDPPAFCKTQKQKAQALSGYQKLYSKIIKLLNPGGTLVAASCTKYVSQEELCQLVDSQAKSASRKALLRDTGVQGMDHPFTGPHDNACYIKYALYAIE